ncbi:TAXI family TRAP transporter solute-binding subunit [Rhodomicrobium sp. R_RK_3]|uniref:TAXI family TRAP transporter solute-binding subunit n=1 Tax=Rhodomicrobium sp. R_RK_3 TaxID=2029567 RepID=UPI001FDA331C|nr:TAXI family TRAP transporter solute-binding subunit [Rhodomicrobium sp. R_RK_3]
MPSAADADPIRPLTLAQAGAARPTANTEGESELVTRINNWTVGVAGGLLEGTFSRFAAELGKAFDDGENLRVLPVLTYGATENISDLLYLKGIDIAITHADVFEEFKKRRNIGNIDKRINYISPMFVSELYIYVRPEIKTIKDLEGKVVSLGTKGAGQTITGPIVFERMGVTVKTVFINNTIAFEKMKSGEIAGLVHSGGKPNDFFTKMAPEPGFHFLAIPYSEKFSDYYVPSTISYKDYPNLMKDGEEVETIGNQVVLAVYNWPIGTDRYRRLERFVQYFFERFDKLRQAPFHPKWKEINLAGTVPGWTRYPLADKMLTKVMAEAKVKERIANTASNLSAGGAGPDNPHAEVTEEQRLFQEFIDWKKKKSTN